MKKLFRFIVIIFIIQSCQSSDDKSQPNFNIVRSPIEIHLKDGSSKFQLGDSVFFSAKSTDDSLKITSVDVLIDDSLLISYDDLPINTSFSTHMLRLGIHKVKVTATTNSSVENKTASFTVCSNMAPIIYDYKVIESYDHDKKAYTQGLFYFDGFLYEGTGQKGLSSVRQVELQSGKVLKQIKNENSIFGEGVALLNNKIYQLSWVSNVGFIYDLNTLELQSKFYYDGEGWGLTSDGKVLFRSDGSNKIFVHKMESFEVLDVIEVYSNESAISELNELEYIDGLIYANIWQKDEIAIINPETGGLEGLINLRNILPSNERDSRTDVLNGIAYDEKEKRLFITGKNWPRLFHIEIEKISL